MSPSAAARCAFTRDGEPECATTALASPAIPVRALASLAASAAVRWTRTHPGGTAASSTTALLGGGSCGLASLVHAAPQRVGLEHTRVE